MTTDRRRWTWAGIAYAPVLVVFGSNFLYVWNHFYTRGPWLLDSGWFSALVYRAGIMPHNPPTTFGDVPYFWGVHPSLLVCVGSLLSYLFPGDRVDWFCVFQALLYVPLAIAFPVLVPREHRKRLSTACLVAVCSLAFSFGGLVVDNIGYPHIEIFAASGIVIMLAGLASNRDRLAWVGLAMCVGTREDGGIQAATFLFAVVASDLLGRPFPIARRRVLVMMGVAFASSIVLAVVQKKLFVDSKGFERLVTGNPAYAHLTTELLRTRFAYFVSKLEVIWWPLLASGVIALVRRDARYLLGWAATIPWFVLNITAFQQAKGEFSTYVVFPFIGSVFWIVAYACVVTDKRERWPHAVAAALSVLSLVGLWIAMPPETGFVLHDAFVANDANPAALRAFAREIRERRIRNLRTDSPMTSWGIEGLQGGDNLSGDEEKSGYLLKGDALAFRANGCPMLGALVDGRLPRCGRVERTPFFLCTTADQPLPSMLVPTKPFLAMLILNPEHPVRRTERGIEVPASPPGIRVFGPNARLNPGAYVATWKIDYGACSGNATDPALRLDVHDDHGHEAAAKDVGVNEHEVTLAFDVTEDGATSRWETRAWSGRCDYELTGLDVEKKKQGAGQTE